MVRKGEGYIIAPSTAMMDAVALLRSQDCIRSLATVSEGNEYGKIALHRLEQAVLVPTDNEQCRSELLMAVALGLAEIERLDRAARRDVEKQTMREAPPDRVG
jgi:hypothetical protein